MCGKEGHWRGDSECRGRNVNNAELAAEQDNEIGAAFHDYKLQSTVLSTQHSVPQPDSSGGTSSRRTPTPTPSRTPPGAGHVLTNNEFSERSEPEMYSALTFFPSDKRTCFREVTRGGLLFSPLLRSTTMPS